MKADKISLAFVAVTLLFIIPASACYKIKSYTIDDGGTVSTGGRFVVMGTIAQPDAGYSYSDQHELLGRAVRDPG